MLKLIISIIASIIAAVIAELIVYFLCKWVYRMWNWHEHKKTGVTAPVFL